MRQASFVASHRTLRARRGDSIVEALVATVLLTVGALALVGLGATLARDERRAALRRRAAVMVAARVGAWTAAPCADADGGGGAPGLVERWRSGATADSLQQLVDSVSSPVDSTAGAVGLTLLRSCAR
jgi:Tfp pilus assembly protein PilV